ncbi:MAG: tRNA epoxyqueuosine(34) reductase QueG [Gammaproteobacteria bacterium]|nr:tRNA epoxyqueuosine(34) reductase QueG [Gammaproteobacteria bacterium]
MQTVNLALANQIKKLGLEFGFQQVGITDTRLDQQHQHYQKWIDEHYHGEMGYMSRNVDKRLNPELLTPDTLSVICVSLDYLHDEGDWPIALLKQKGKAYVSRYALGRDYHKLMRKHLKHFAEKIAALVGNMGYRVFTDSAPVLEKALATKAGIGWQGKHSNILNRSCGSWFFLGEIYTDLKLAIDKPVENHCGRCISCIDVCPTQAIIAPYVVDARRCISYLTIEHHSAIPVEFRSAIGNRIYGCDDCQLFCPWNRFANDSKTDDFKPRHGLDKISLSDCFSWSEETFEQNTLGSAIRRIGYQRWLRNVVVALGNADYDPYIIKSLKQDYESQSDMLREHIDWAIGQQQSKSA